ncbi:MAG: hypothetical protein ACI4A5_03130 [Hominilimicola sp.]
MTQKKLYLILVSALTIIIALILFLTGNHITTHRLAKEKLDKEITSAQKTIDDLQTQKDEVQQQISDIETELSTKSTINNYYMEYKKTYDELTNEITDLKKQSAQLDTEIEAKQQELEKSSGISEDKKGKSYTLKKDQIYTCPDKIPAGRYTVSGSGTLVITTSTGKVRATQNLDVAYDNSYTFTLSDKEQIKVSSEVTITELK